MPAVYDRVVIDDPVLGVRVGGTVESPAEGAFDVRLDYAADLHGEAVVRWFDGGNAWRATVQLIALEATRVRCELITPGQWQAAAGRTSPRVSAHASRMLGRIVWSRNLPGGRRFHAVCLDLSATGCRAAWTGAAPAVGDTIELTWDAGAARGAAELGWVPARVVRVAQVPSGQIEVAFSFTITKATQAARIRAWHQDWARRQAP